MSNESFFDKNSKIFTDSESFKIFVLFMEDSRVSQKFRNKNCLMKAVFYLLKSFVKEYGEIDLKIMRAFLIKAPQNITDPKCFKNLCFQRKISKYIFLVLWFRKSTKIYGIILRRAFQNKIIL